MTKAHPLLWILPLVLLAVACGPYRTETEATAEARERVIGASVPAECARTTAAPLAVTPTAVAPDDSTTTVFIPFVTSGAVTATAEAIASATPAADAHTWATATACAASRDDVTAIVEATPTLPEPTPILAITSTPAPATATPTPTATVESTPDPTGTSAAATATALASGQATYLSIGDGLQWGCCGFISQSSPSLFRDYLELRLNRPVIWQSAGTGYLTTSTFIDDGSPEPPLAFAINLINHYQGTGAPIAAITMSIGGNNLVDIGNNCAAPPCTDAFVAGLNKLRADLHVIHAQIASAKAPNVPVMVLLYYDANQCTGDPNSGAAVDAWNAVIAEVAGQYGAFTVDARTLFKGHCDWFDANGLDANAAGHAAIAAEYQRVYESLPPQYQLAPR